MIVPNRSKNKKRGRPKRSIPKEVNCQQELLNTKLKDMFVLRKPGRPRRLVLKEMEGQEIVVSSFNQERDMLVTGTGEENCNKKGKYAQVNYRIEGADVNHPIWSGSISIPHESFGVVDGLEAYISSRAGLQVADAVQRLPVLLNAQLLSRLDLLPNDCPQTHDVIDLYIVPANERSQDAFDRLHDAITREDAVLKAVYADVSVLIFSSLQLTYPNWRTNSGKYYLWAVLEGKNPLFPHCEEDNFSKMNFVDVPVVYRTDELQLVTENQGHDNALLPGIETRPVGRSPAYSEQEIRGGIVHSTRPEFSATNYTESPSAYSERIGASVLKMVKHFDDQTCPEEEEISSAFAVEQKYAQTLRAILEKHGDITQNCGIKCIKMLTCALEGVCQTLQDLENMCFADLRKNRLESMLSAISDAEMIKLDVKWLRKRYEELVEAVEELKEYQALKYRRKEVEERVAAKEVMISCKEDEVVKLQGQIEKLKSEIEQATLEKERLSSEVAQGNQEKERLSSDIRNVTSKCNYFSHHSLVEGLI